MDKNSRILVVGAAQWDFLGRTEFKPRWGDDLPGKIFRKLGGVGLTAALALLRINSPVQLISAIGADNEGELLLHEIKMKGLETHHIVKNSRVPTDRYLAIEDRDSLALAIADCRCLKESEPAILQSSVDWIRQHTKGTHVPTMIVDGNLSARFTRAICAMKQELTFKLTYIAASQAKTDSCEPLLGQSLVSIYLNRIEAEAIAKAPLGDSLVAAKSLLRLGFARVVVTDGNQPASDGDSAEVVSAPPQPSPYPNFGVTGAGDVFAVTHMNAIEQGFNRRLCLEMAHLAAAKQMHTSI